MNYTEFCMKQIEFWEQKLFEAMTRPDDMITEIDQITKRRNVEELKDLYDRLKSLEASGKITKEEHRQYLTYISTGRAA